MVFLELALYGIRNFAQLTRLSFKPGFNLIVGGNGSGKTTVRDTLFAVLSPLSGTAVDRLKSRGAPVSCQAAVIFKTPQGRVYRLVRDFIGQKSSLAELDASQKFQFVTQEEEAVNRFFSDEIVGWPLRTLEGLYSLNGAWMPSTPDAAVRPSAAIPARSDSQPLEASRIGIRILPQDRAQKEKRLEELKGFLSKGEQLARLEDQLSDLQSRSAELKHRLRLASEAMDGLGRQDASFETLQKLPKDFPRILENAAQQEQLKNEQMSSIAEEEEFSKQELAGLSDQPFFLNRLFIAGGGAVLLSLIIAVFVNLEGIFRHLLILSMLTGAGLMGYVGYLDLVKNTKRKTLEAKLRETERQRLRLEAAFKKENAACIELLKKTGCRTITALREKLKAHEQVLATRRQMEAERDQSLGGKTAEALRGELDSLTRQMTAIEAELKASSTLPSDIYLIQEEIRILEQDTASPSSADPEPDRTVFQEAVSADPASIGPPPDVFADFLPPPFRSGLEVPPVKNALIERRSELAERMTHWIGKLDGSLDARIRLNEDLMPSPSLQASSPFSWGALSSGQQSLYRLAYQLAVVQILADSRLFPLILDHPLSGLDPLHQQKAVDVFREIAQRMQVLLLSSVSYPNQESDHFIQLK